jgi:hypothetical protein
MRLPEEGRTARHLLADIIVLAAIVYPVAFTAACYWMLDAFPRWPFFFVSAINLVFCSGCAKSIREMRTDPRFNGPSWDWETNPVRFTLKLVSMLLFFTGFIAALSVSEWSELSVKN